MSEPQLHLLIVDDDERIRGLLQKFLIRSGFLVTTARDAAQARRLIAGLDFDLIVLDVMMPGEDGISFTRDLRKRLAMPILLLTARGETANRIEGLEAGADDYLAKPFSPRELLARLRALLRRAQAAPSMPDQEAYRFGPYCLDLAARRLLKDDIDLGLSGAEFDLIKAFTERPNRVLTRDILMDLLKGYEWDPNDRTVDLRVARLRRKLEPDPANPVYIRTVRGEGYLFNPRGAGT